MEAVPLNTSFYKEALIVLGAAAIVIPLFHRLHISSVLGFMLVGVAVGPFGLASFTPYLPWLSPITISEPESISRFRSWSPFFPFGNVYSRFLMENLKSW